MSYCGKDISDHIISDIINRLEVTRLSGADTALLPPYASYDAPLPSASLSCILPYRDIPFSGLDCKIDGKVYHVDPGECFFFPQGSRRSFIRNDDGHRSIWVHLNIVVKPDLQLMNFFHVPFVIRGQTAVRCRRFMNILNGGARNILRGTTLQTIVPYQKRSFPNQLEDRAVCFLLLKEILSLSRPKEELFLLADSFHEIEPAIQMIRTHCFEKISLDTLAAACHYSKSAFEKKFRRIFGISPGKYLLNFRLSKTERMLKNTDATCGQIAESAGFANQFIFSRHFKKRYGVSPKEYRNMKDIS